MITGADSQAGVSVPPTTVLIAGDGADAKATLSGIVQAGVGTVALALARPGQKQRTPLPVCPV